MFTLGGLLAPVPLRRLAISAVGLWFFCSCLCRSGEQARESGDAHAAHPVEIQMRNINFRLARDIVLEVRDLRGQLQRTKPAMPVSFDDPDSFRVRVDSAQVAIAPASLTALMNSYVLAYEGAPIKNVVVSIDRGRLIQKGTLHKGIDLPFEIRGSVSATGDGKIRIHADKIKSAHVPVKGLLHFFGEDLSKLVNQRNDRGMSIAADDIILSPDTLTPPPHFQGRVVRVSIVNGKMVQWFDSGRGAPPLKPPLRSISPTVIHWARSRHPVPRMQT